MKLYAELIGTKLAHTFESDEASSSVNIIDITGVDLSGFTQPGYDYATSTWVEYVEPAKTLDELKYIKLNELNNHYTNLFNSIQPKVKAEKESWNIQQDEWSRYINDINSNTPYVDSLAVGRGITRDELMTKIGIKVIGFATIQGQLQGYEDQIEAATTEAELDLIIW